MNFNLIKIQKLISKSELTKEDQGNLLNLFSKAKDEDLRDTVDLFEENSSQIKIISDVYKAKIKAFKNKDKKAWEKILQQEHQDLEKIEKSNL